MRKRRRRKVIHADAVNEDCDREHATLVHKDYDDYRTRLMIVLLQEEDFLLSSIMNPDD